MRSTCSMTYGRTRACVDALKRFKPACSEMGNAAHLLRSGVDDNKTASVMPANAGRNR